MMTRFSRVFLMIAAVAAIPAAVHADTITLTDWNWGHFVNNAAGGGGPFLATTSGPLLGNSQFMTFCIEYNEHFNPGGTYNVTLSDGAIGGGVGGGNPDPLSDATKWIYYQAVSGGYSSWYSPLNNNVGASFQNAIWWLENERTTADLGGTSAAGYVLAQYAIANQNWGSLDAQGHRVYAMNLTDGNHGAVQDQLAYTSPVPEPGSLLLFGTGLVGGLRAWRKRRG
jgi:hypothetical protein